MVLLEGPPSPLASQGLGPHSLLHGCSEEGELDSLRAALTSPPSPLSTLGSPPFRHPAKLLGPLSGIFFPTELEVLMQKMQSETEMLKSVCRGVDLCPLKTYVKVLTLGTLECDIIWKRFAEVIS